MCHWSALLGPYRTTVLGGQHLAAKGEGWKTLEFKTHWSYKNGRLIYRQSSYKKECNERFERG